MKYAKVSSPGNELASKEKMSALHLLMLRAIPTQDAIHDTRITAKFQEHNMVSISD
jgi:hypothetical protein